MTPEINAEFLRAVHSAFGALDYGIIGGAALTGYGSRRGTSDVDIMVPQQISEVVEDQLLSRGMVRTAAGKLGYVHFQPTTLITGYMRTEYCHPRSSSEQ